jgi:hypothetical protein
VPQNYTKLADDGNKAEITQVSRAPKMMRESWIAKVYHAGDATEFIFDGLSMICCRYCSVYICSHLMKMLKICSIYFLLFATRMSSSKS